MSSLPAISLRGQVAAASTVVVLLVSLFVGIYYPARSARVAMDAQTRSVAGVAEMVALSVGVGLRLQEPRAIAAAFAWARRDSSLRFVAVLDTGGTLIAAYNPDHLEIPVATERLRHRVHELQGHFVVAAPVRFQDLTLGDVVIASSLATIQANAARDRRAGLAGSGVLFLLGIGLSIWTASRITRPIVTLRHATEQIASGRYDVELDVRAGAEVGALATAFSAMAGKIRSQMSDLERQANELVTARDAALSATVAKSTFLATMSHEIRTPMNGVIGMLELLDDGQLRTDQRKFVRTASRSAEALLTILNDILDFSKVEAGKLDIERIEFDLWSTIGDVITLLSERAHAKGLALVSAIAPDVPTMVWGDPGRLRQVLLNLTGNAIKFTESGDIVVKVARVASVDDPSRIRFEITDSGLGIPPEVTSRLFQPFSQADSSTTRRFGGTGLGLAICRQLVGLMGGEIGVISAVGAGSTFWFTTHSEAAAGHPQPQPVASPIACPAGHAAAIPAPTAAIAMTRTGDILLVEDNEVNQLVAVEMLGRLGYQVDVVASGLDAIAAVEGKRYDAVLMDCQMNGMDGLQTTAELRRRGWGSDRLPIIAMTAEAMQGDRERCLAAGMDEYLAKPVRRALLTAMLDRFVVNAPPPDGAALAGGSTDLIDGVLDAEQLQDLLGDDRTAWRRYLTLFLGTAGPTLTALRQGIDQEQSDTVRRAAHQLKGSAATIGAVRVAELARHLELVAESGDWHGAGATHERLDTAVSRVATIMDTL